jgi:predicted Zn-dependent protease
MPGRLRLLPALAALLLTACSTVAYTGRKQMAFLDAGTEMSLGADSYKEELKKVKLAKDPDQIEMVKRVSFAIAREASRDEKILAGFPEVKDFKWEVHLVDNKAINANCRPGGKMIVYTGILPVCETEAGLAAVMGHEVAHAVCRHGNERISQGVLAQAGLAGLHAGMRKKDPAVQGAVMAAMGAGVSVGVLLPFSRAHESEADRVGLILMAKAGYDPHEAEKFWTRMSKQSKGEKPPEWLSTHPSDETRIRQIREWLPEALQYYKPKPQ